MNRRVLLIDADPAFRDTLTQQLGRYRIVVMTEPDAERALAIASSDAPQLIVIGVEEPEKAGFRVFQKCKKGALAKVPIMLVTASVAPESFAKHGGLKVHADAYLDKRSMTPDELVGKIDNLLTLGEPQDDDDELGIPVEDDIPMEIADGDVVLDETVGDDQASEFANDARTVGPGHGMVDQMVEAETDAAFEALLGGDDAPRQSRAASKPAIVDDEVAIPEIVPHTDGHGRRSPTAPPPVHEAIPAQIHDTGAPAEDSFSQIGAPTVDPREVADEDSPAHDRMESSPAIQLDDEELVPLEEEVELEAGEPPPPARPVHEAPTVMRTPIITDEARPKLVEPSSTVGPPSGSHPAIDLGLEAVANDVRNEQSGVYDRKALRKIGELERQIAQLKAELERARTQADAASKGAGREREFLNLRESILAKDKELKQVKDAVDAHGRELADTREKLTVAQHAKGVLEAKNAELEQRLFDDSGKSNELAAAIHGATAQAEALQQELDAKTKALAAAEALRSQLEHDLATERSRAQATASEAEQSLRAEREQLVERHRGELAAVEAAAQTSLDTALAQLREQLDEAHAAGLNEAVEEVRRANAAELETTLAELNRKHAGDLVALKDQQAGALTRIRGELGAEVERVKAEWAEAEAEAAAAIARAAEQYAAQVEELTTKHAGELASRDDEHAEARERDAESHGQALAQLKSQLDRMAANHEVKLDEAQRELETLVAHHETAKGELHAQHEAALADVAAKHAQELAKLHDDRSQLADAARRTAEAHRATVAEVERKHAEELVQAHETAERELAEQRGAVLAARRAADDAAARHQAERDTASAAHAQAIAELEAKHERALAIANGEILRTKAVADVEHKQAVAALQADADKQRAELTAEGEELRRGLSSARDALKRSEGELGSAVQTIADRNADLRTHAAAIAERDQRIADLRKEIESLEQENASYQEQVLRAYQKIKSDEAMVARARKAMAIALTVLDDQGNPTS